jgi:hypothetical protein
MKFSWAIHSDFTHYGMDYIINIKPVGNASLFEQMHERFQRGELTKTEEILDDGTRRGYRFAADFALNGSHPNNRVNMLEYWIVDKNQKTTNFSWITNLSITIENVHAIAQAGRTRWSIENELFNTLKNQGYELEHNYGHGKQYLSSTLAGLMLLAFLTDQLQNHACQLFKAARCAQLITTKLRKQVHLPGTAEESASDLLIFIVAGVLSSVLFFRDCILLDRASAFY